MHAGSALAASLPRGASRAETQRTAPQVDATHDAPPRIFFNRYLAPDVAASLDIGALLQST